MMGGGSELLTQRGQKNEGRVKSDQPGAEPRDCRSWLWGISLLSLLRTRKYAGEYQVRKQGQIEFRASSTSGYPGLCMK